MSGQIPKAIYGAEDRPLNLGGFDIPCYILEDGKRVLVQRGMMQSLDMKQGTAGRGGGDRLAKFISTKGIKPYVSDELAEVITSPIKFVTPNGSTAYGYEATILADICDAVLDARNDKKLNYQQEHIAKQCEILVRGFARVGIIALVDEATGYQDVRARDALAKILEKFLDDELHKWTKTFPDEFYKEIFRLRGWQYKPWSVKRPGVIGRWTNDFVYDRLAPGVLKELQRLNPTDIHGRRQTTHHQWFNTDYGHPKLKEHISGVLALMRAAPNWRTFKSMLNRAYPKFGEQLMLDLEYEDLNDN